MKKYIIAAAMLFSLASCNDYALLEQNPNIATSVPAELALRNVLSSLNESAWNTAMRNNQFYCSNYNYYDNNEYNWGAASLQFTTLKNVIKLEEEALKSGAKALNPYSAMGKFLRAYFYTKMTLNVGDLPVKDALQGLTISTPKYDTQKEVFIQVLAWLEQANTEMAQLIANGDKTFSGDIYFGGDLTKWQKAVNALQLRVLIHLSKKADDTDLSIKQKFNNILSNPTKYPLFTSNDESVQYVWSSINKYPRNPDNFGNNATRENMSKTYIDLLKEYQDPRLFVVAEPAEAKIKAGLTATDFAAYEGASSGEDLADMSTKAGNGQYSFQSRKRYYGSYTGENTFVLSYPEMCFNIAEGINRTWATGSAQDWYEKGIKASMAFYGVTTPANYLTQTAVQYKGNNADGLAQILKQKYLAFFQNSGYEAFYNQRRTGIPTFLIGVGTGNGTRIPKRFQYPATESTTNKTNYQAALTRQFTDGKDDINSEMWLVK